VCVRVVGIVPLKIKKYLIADFFGILNVGSRQQLESFSDIQFNSLTGLTAFTSKMNCDLTAIGLPPVTSVVFLIIGSFW
jgi:hypothetical protein